MTQQTETTRYRFDAKILGKEERGQKVAVKVDWKLPGAKFELVLYLDPDEAQPLDVGDRLNWSITRGGLGKARDGSAKTGQYQTDYFWDWDKEDSHEALYSNEYPEGTPDEAERSMEQDFTQTQPGLASEYPPDYQVPDDVSTGNLEPGQGGPRVMEPQGRAENAGIKVEGVVQGHVEKLAVDLYRSYLPELLGDIDYLKIREIRDSFFHQVKEKPIMPIGYCYRHESGTNLDSHGNHYHKVEENYCINGEYFVDGNGERVDD